MAGALPGGGQNVAGGLGVTGPQEGLALGDAGPAGVGHQPCREEAAGRRGVFTGGQRQRRGLAGGEGQVAAAQVEAGPDRVRVSGSRGAQGSHGGPALVGDGVGEVPAPVGGEGQGVVSGPLGLLGGAAQGGETMSAGARNTSRSPHRPGNGAR